MPLSVFEAVFKWVTGATEKVEEGSGPEKGGDKPSDPGSRVPRGKGV